MEKVELNGIKHIAIIMDGNGRWAKKRGLPRTAGHLAGIESFKKITDYLLELGLDVLTVYTFSTENWKRPANEINYIMTMLDKYFTDVINSNKFNQEKNIQIRIIGDVTRLSINLQDKIKKVIQKTEQNTKMIVNLAINYGGRNEICNAIKKIYSKIENKQLNKYDITEQTIAEELYTQNIPDPDIVIRSGGETRISNFMIWQSAYSEFIFTDVLWPDFNETNLKQAVLEYHNRNRRFGGV